MPVTIKRKVTKRAEAQRAKRSLKFLLTSPRSPLASVDLRTILCNDGAWTCLDRADQDQILALFPDQRHIIDAGSPHARPNLASLRNDDGFRDDCTAYVQNLAAGRFNEAWLADAWRAHSRRRAGVFAAHLNERFQREWAVELPAAEPTKTSESSAGEGF